MQVHWHGLALGLAEQRCRELDEAVYFSLLERNLFSRLAWMAAHLQAQQCDCVCFITLGEPFAS